MCLLSFYKLSLVTDWYVALCVVAFVGFPDSISFFSASTDRHHGRPLGGVCVFLSVGRVSYIRMVVS